MRPVRPVSTVLPRSIALSVCALVTGVTLVACGPAPWSVAPTGAGATSMTVAPPAPVQNDLSGGSTKRTLEAGAVSVEVTYWSTLAMDTWTANALKPVTLSLSATVTPDDGKTVGLQRVTMTAVPTADGQTFPPLETQVDQSNQPAGYLVLAPTTYQQVFNVGQVPAETTSVTLQFAYEFLMETAPASGKYAKLTASDTLVVAIVGGGTPAS